VAPFDRSCGPAYITVGMILSVARKTLGPFDLAHHAYDVNSLAAEIVQDLQGVMRHGVALI
jgi:hypothetical protein